MYTNGLFDDKAAEMPARFLKKDLTIRNLEPGRIVFIRHFDVYVFSGSLRTYIHARGEFREEPDDDYVFTIQKTTSGIKISIPDDFSGWELTDPASFIGSDPEVDFFPVIEITIQHKRQIITDSIPYAPEFATHMS